MKVLQLPERNLGDIPAALRRFADNIEKGKHGACFHIAWVCDEGNPKISVGLCGQSPEPGAVAHYLLALGMRELEKSR